ncbi:MAG: rod shape-determining protein MreC [Kiritimatiellae bacterium]|nr:rod shape-determining protein MreC [Kiritimatiellia bacterium]
MRNRTVFYILGFCAILLFLLCNTTMRAICNEAIYPFQRISTWMKSQTSSRLVAAWRGLCDGPTRDNFSIEIDRLRIMLQESEAIAQENVALRKALDWKNRQLFNVIAAPVWSHGGGLGVWPRLQLAVGSVNGVAKGDIVVVPEGLVGRIADSVTTHTSEVILLSDPGCHVAVEVPGGVKGVVQGAQGHDFGRSADEPLLYTIQPFVMRFVSRNAPVTPGDVLYTEGSGGLFARGIKVGTILEREISSANLLAEILVEPAVDPTLLRTVFVLTRPTSKDKEHPFNER